MVGQIVENFSLKDEMGNVFSLYDNLDKKILLVFYPKDNSPVCSKQLKNYSINKEEFDKHNIKIVGINPGSIKEHQDFCNNKNLNIPLLIDENKEVCLRFDAVNFVGGIKRKLVLIGTDKRIIFEKVTFALFYLNSKEILSEINKN